MNDSPESNQSATELPEDNFPTTLYSVFLCLTIGGYLYLLFNYSTWTIFVIVSVGLLSCMVVLVAGSRAHKRLEPVLDLVGMLGGNLLIAFVINAVVWWSACPNCGYYFAESLGPPYRGDPEFWESDENRATFYRCNDCNEVHINGKVQKKFSINRIDDKYRVRDSQP